MPRHAGFVAGLVILIVACGGTPDAVEGRPELETCNPSGEEVFIPARQGPADAEDRSEAAIECILDAHGSGLGREVDFVLLGTEGDHHRLIIQTLVDGTVNAYQQVDEWSISEKCRNLRYDGVFFFVGDCATAQPPRDDAPSTTTSGDLPEAVPLPDEYPLGIPAGYVPACVEDTLVNFDVRVRVVELAGFPAQARGDGSDAIEVLVDFFVGELAAIGYSPAVSFSDGDYGDAPVASIEAAGLGGSFAIEIRQQLHGVGVITLWASGMMIEGEIIPVRPCDRDTER